MEMTVGELWEFTRNFITHLYWWQAVLGVVGWFFFIIICTAIVDR
jgi:hypothetical protein